MSKKRRVRHADTDDVEPKENQELETEDIYDDKQRDTMLNEDEITASENAFMEGREMDMKKKSKSSHDDSVSVELVKHEYEED